MAATTELSSQELHALCQRFLTASGERQLGAASWIHNAKSAITSFKVLSYHLKPASDSTVGFLGRHQVLYIEVAIKDANGSEKRDTLRFFAKSAPSELATRMEYIESFGVFRKEILIYRQVFPNLQQQLHKDISARCYYAENNLLVFEDLTAQGYRLAAGRDGLLDYAHLKCVLRTLAALHASSLVYELRQGKRFPELHPEAVMENAYPDVADALHMRLQNFNNALLVLVEFIKLMPKYKDCLPTILPKFSRNMALIFEMVKVSENRLNVFLHGDLWANNIMFKYDRDGAGKQPVDCRLVDFQLSRYGSPVLDVITVLTIPTTRAFRRQHMRALLNEYYANLRELLKQANLNITDFINEQQFEEAVHEFRVGGLVESCLFSHLTILPEESTQSLTGTENGFSDFFQHKRIAICLSAFHNDVTYRGRMTDMIEEIIEDFVLQ